MDTSFKPRVGRFGVSPYVMATGQIGGANFLGGATPLTANSTTIFRLGPVPRKSFLSRFGASTVTVPVDADGTIVAYVIKYNAATDTAVGPLTANLNLEALVTREGILLLPAASATEAQLLFNEGDTLEVHVVNNSAAIDTQPAGLVFTVELLMLE